MSPATKSSHDLNERSAPLLDRFGRRHNNLRISVTDRCNIRCFYCMPDENLEFKQREELLSFEEITRFVEVAAAAGVNKLRITGGEPLVRKDLPRLIQQLRSIPGIDDIAMTTNGILLDRYAVALKQAGLDRVNVSLDTLREEVFQRIARRSGLQQVLAGIHAAQVAGLTPIRLNAVAIAGMTEDDIVPLGEFARQHDLEMRFIEFMPLDAEENWTQNLVLTGKAIRNRLETAFGPLVAAERKDPSQPAIDFRFADGKGRIGFINPVSAPFCGDCNRLRLTAEGQLRNCLFSTSEWDARALLRNGGCSHDIEKLIRDSLAAKAAGHGIDSQEFQRPGRAMYQIGG